MECGKIFVTSFLTSLGIFGSSIIFCRSFLSIDSPVSLFYKTIWYRLDLLWQLIYYILSFHMHIQRNTIWYAAKKVRFWRCRTPSSYNYDIKFVWHTNMMEINKHATFRVNCLSRDFLEWYFCLLLSFNQHSLYRVCFLFCNGSHRYSVLYPLLEMSSLHYIQVFLLLLLFVTLPLLFLWVNSLDNYIDYID